MGHTHLRAPIHGLHGAFHNTALPLTHGALDAFDVQRVYADRGLTPVTLGGARSVDGRHRAEFPRARRALARTMEAARGSCLTISPRRAGGNACRFERGRGGPLKASVSYHWYMHSQESFTSHRLDCSSYLLSLYANLPYHLSLVSLSRSLYCITLN